MKISIAWVFDHIDADWRTVDIPQLCEKFNETTAEIERWEKITTDFSQFDIGKVVSVGKTVVVVLRNGVKEIQLPLREGAQSNQNYFIYNDGTTIRWATSLDFGSNKEYLLPAVDQSDDWKKGCEPEDYILEVDNKSITNRPDLWGHRGFAREIAAILNLKLKPFDEFCVDMKTESHDTKATASSSMPFSIAIEDPKQCKRFAGIYLSGLTHTAALPWMSLRLARVDARSIDALIDMTNYAMLDTSQPMHAFDADTLKSKNITARQARKKEKITLLDDTVLELTPEDIIIVDGDTPISLAGIKGGKGSGVSSKTTNILLESANFDPATIRKIALRQKVRTEASARFEKSLDPNQNIDAILRYRKLLDQAGISYKVSEGITSVGTCEKPLHVSVSHAFIEEKLGVPIETSFITDTLTRLAFTVKSKSDKEGMVYDITIPLFRSTKDIALKEDIVEEIGRFYGYGNIPFILPSFQTEPTPMHAPEQVYAIKRYCAFSMQMRELYNYPFFDESFLKKITFDPGKVAQVANPVSENWHRLVTTLAPHMLRGVYNNHVAHDSLRFFEWARVWSQEKDVVEKKVLAGVLYQKRTPIDFYDVKAYIVDLYHMIKAEVQWIPADGACDPWFDQSRTASIMHDGKRIGIMGAVDSSWMSNVMEGHAYLFELDGNFLEQYKAPVHRYAPSSKYQATERDVSIMVPLTVTVDALQQAIKGIDKVIVSVRLLDFFQKKEWSDKKSLTLRYVVQDPEKTMTKQEIDAIGERVIKAVTKLGASVR